MKAYLFIEQNILNLRKEIRQEKKHLFKQLHEQCSRYKSEVLPVEHPPKSTTYMGMAVANLSLAYLLTKQDHYLVEAKRWINAVINYPHWGNAHLVDVDLSAAWLLFGLSCSYDWIKEDLSKDEQEAIKNKLVLQANRMYQFKKKTEGKGWSTNYWQNHNWINLTGLAACGYALKNDVKDAQVWIDDAKVNFEKVYSVLPDDGSDYEGVVYWRYGAMWLFVYAHLLKTAEGLDVFKTSSFLKNTFYYRLYQAAPNLEEIINYGDCHDRRSGHSAAVYYKVASEYQNGHAQTLGNRVISDFLYREQYESQVKPGILPEAMFTLLWYNPSIEEKTFEDLPLSKYFEDLGLCVIRSSWNEDAIHFSFKSGHPGGKKQWKHGWELKKELGYESLSLSHQHPDSNHFILNAYGSFLAIDEGYNRHVKANEHNIITIDGVGYVGDGQNDVFKNITEDSVAEIETYMTGYEMTAFIGETSQMYPRELQLKRNARHVIYTNQGYFIMLDELRSDLPHRYEWHMHADTTPIKLSDTVFDYENGLAKLELMHLFPKVQKIKHLETNVRAVMTTQEPDNYRETKMKTVQISSSLEKDVNFLNVLVPRRFNEDSPVKVERFSNGTTIGVKVYGKTFTDLFYYSDKKKIEYQDLQANASWVLLQYQGEELVYCGCHEATKIVLNDDILYQGDQVSQFMQIKK
jgi:Domain of unknown function (DUF4962)/Heparinase II/III-like protein